MHELRTSIDIDAPARRVWEIVTAFDAYPEWNPFMRSISGAAVPGTRLEVEIAPPGGRAMTFKPTVLAAEPERELRWRGRLILPGIFDGEHSLGIEPLGEDRVRFVQAERFSGLLVPLARKGLAKTERGFTEMNEALKRRAEGA